MEWCDWTPVSIAPLVDVPEPTNFRVYPEGRDGYYFTVYVFRSRHRMYRFYTASTRRRKRDFLAVVISWASEGPELGQILFSPVVTMETVAHEMLHAAMTWAGETGVVISKPRGEEKLAQVVGRLTAQFWRRFAKTVRIRKVK